MFLMKRGRKIMIDNSKGIISLKKVNKGYAGKQVIFDVNLNVPFGEIFGLLGLIEIGRASCRERV